MFDIRKYNYTIPNTNKITLLVFSDLHYSNTFSTKRLNKLKEKINQIPCDYILLVGDLLDSGKVLTKTTKEDTIINFITFLGEKASTIITLGNHDMYIDNYNFWDKVSNIKGVHTSYKETFYEDNNLLVYLPSIPKTYYEKKGEDKEILTSIVSQDLKEKDLTTNKKIKIMLCHSPMNIKQIKKYIINFNFIFSGHMHNGMIPYITNKIIKNNTGIISPDKIPFPKVARGIVDIKYQNKTTHLIISGGITKLSEKTGIIHYLNFIYPSSIDIVNINKTNK